MNQHHSPPSMTDGPIFWSAVIFICTAYIMIVALVMDIHSRSAQPIHTNKRKVMCAP